MSKRRTQIRDRERIERATSAPPKDHRSRWIAGAAILVGLGIGVVVVERLTRPGDKRLSTIDIPQQALIAGANALIPPPRAEPTFTETVAEGKQLGKEVAEQFPENARALALAGKMRFTFGEPDQAQDAWERTVKLDPQSAEAWLGLAKTAHKRGDFDRAVQCMQRLGEVAAEDADSQVFFLVDSLLKLGRPQEVVDRLEKLGQSASLPGGARVALGQAHYQLQHYEQSADQYRQALDDPPQAGVAHYGLSSALMRLGRHDEAKLHRQEYARLQEKSMDVFDRMQGAGTDQERHDPSPLYPILASFHFEAAKLYAIRGQRDQAAEHAWRAWALAPDRREPKAFLESL
jgi:tetratricopeptide (TPR) repeat protein